MKRTLKLLGAAFVAAAWTGVVLAGNYTNNFDGDPATNNPGFLILSGVGGRVAAAWHAYDGDPILTYAGGIADNNSTTGFVELVDGNGNENIVMVFPDIDGLTNIDNTTTPPTTNISSLPVKALTLDLDLRAGNGTTTRPADGFSISYARSGDAVLVAATNNAVGGFAGGDSLTAAQDPAGSGDVENGTKSGVAIVFDAWQGNWLPDTTPIPGGSNDREGVTVRVDDVTLFQSDLSANRNLGCQSNPPVTSLSALSEQTGLNDLNATGYTNLCWQHLKVVLTTAPAVTVTFKNFTVLNNFSLSGYSATQGRLVFAARTGGSAQHVDIDNIHLVTVPISNPFIQTVSGIPNGCVVTLFDVGAAVTTNLVFVGLDTNTPAIATNVTAYSSITNEGGTVPGGPHHYIVVNLPYRLAPNSRHLVTAVWQDSVNGTTNDTGTIAFTVPNYLAFPTNFALPLSSVDTSRPGFLARSFQSLHHVSPGIPNWTDELVEGLHGPNNADQAVNFPGSEAPFLSGYFPDGSGAFDLATPLNFNTGGVTPNDPGFFNTVSNPDFDFNLVGVGVLQPNYLNSAVELSAYMAFPTSGVYQVVLGADNLHDGYRISVGASPFDRIGFSAALSVNAGGASLPGLTGPKASDAKFFLVDAPGVYPMRFLWTHNNGDPGGLEIYQTYRPFTVNGTNTVPIYVLLNDTNTVSEGLPPSILAYEALLPSVQSAPYIAKANPVYNSADVLFYQPIVVDLQDGFPSGLTVNTNSVTMVTDLTNSQTLSVTQPSSGLTQVVQQHSGAWTNWTFGSHSVTLSFNDNLGTNYSSTWSFTVNPNANPTNVVQVPGAFRVDPSTLDLGQPGFRIYSYQQNSRDQNNSQGFVEEAFEGLRGPNIADQSGTSGNGYYTQPGILDYNLPAQTAPAGEYNFDNALWSGTRGSAGGFGFGVNNSPNEPTGNISDEIELDIQGWLVFPSAGLYTFNFNSDDGDTIMMPFGNSLTNKAALTLAISDVGRGSAGPAQPVGGTYAVLNIPQAGAFPVPHTVQNGGGGANLEFSAYSVQADGSLVKSPVNDPTDPNSILAYQVSSVPVGPSITYMNPVRNAQDALYYQPNVIKITDGSSTVSGSITLKTDGVTDSISTSKSAGVTTILQNMGSSVWYQGLHTNILLYSDNLGNAYSNWWRFTVISRPDFISGAEGTPVAIPASSVIPAALVDLTQPGFRILSYETTAGQANTAQWTEEQLQGLHGPNIAVPPTNGLPYYTWNTFVDFGIVPVAGGDYWYDYPAITNSPPNGGLGLVINGGASPNVANCTLEIGTYLVFPSAGLWTFTVDSDDGFKVTVPDGGGTNSSPFQQVGTVVGWNNTGRGNSGGHTPFGPTGSRTFYTINMPSAGAIPVRLLYENGGGGANLEWEIFQWLPDGSIQETLVGDTNGVVKAYQALLTPATPYVAAVNPIPGLQEGLATPAVTLQSGAINQQNLTIVLKDGALAVDTNTVSVTFNGVAQPIVVTTNGAGLTTIFRSGTNFWPSGTIGSLVVTYKDTLGNTYTKPIATANTSFYGTLTGGYPTGSGDTNKPGFLARTWQVDQTGSDGTPGELQANEQILAGIWTNNVANLTGANNVGPNGLGYYVLQGTGPVNGVINFANSGGANNNQGDFQPNNGYPEASYSLVGIPGHTTIAGNSGQCYVTEFLSYIDFPAAGTYYLGVNSDDGFVVTRGWGAPNDNGALIVNSPASLAGKKPAAPSPYPASTQVTNFITGNVVLAMGIADGSTTNGEACVITNGAALAGNIALVYVSASCNAQQQIANCVAAGAIAVLQSKNSAPGNGFMPGLVGSSSSQPAQPIPAIQISRETANAILAALATNTVNVTLTPYDFMVNPSAAQSPIGMADFGKGPSDVDFPVIVPQAGVFPVRLFHFANPGGNEVEFYSVGTNAAQRTLINDGTATNGLPALHAYWGVTVKPSIALTISGSSITVTNTGTLQMSSDLVNWADVYGDGPVTTVQTSGSQQFFRAR